ncbi:pyridoxal 5'-phosphate synthase glutaminase subunit PdxT [Corynebacterium anserum]|uniref:Pyridoxal 5'-phosphate synthase subunit PdxT n=1 Tax=Corynebacterium anserum TaxID=2684406 RepID=A0A7G7YNK8_9CORY|nr:pyridoxal 5'-phosphate synthase glutaminase subunit PdxT [Corynebacterium anserum]QNH96078.1 pyridoxal 5'-phosphate synthase glutaminase subunit PdxT [Corynebacterium anserum]
MSSTVTIGVLSVQGGVAEHIRMIEGLGAKAVPVRRAEHLAGLDGIILPGGESTTMSRLLRLGGMLAPLRAAIDGGLPSFGTCAGLIMLATEVLDTREDAVSLQVLDVTVRRNAFGRQVNSFETHVPFLGIEQPVHAVFIRAPRVERVGDNVDVMCTVDGGTIVGVRQGHVLGTSFHPELSEDDSVHKYFLQMVRDAVHSR